MPWIDQESCTGCGVCIDECPVDAIVMQNESAEIDMSECIRCGICHDICAQDSIHHDSDKIPNLIQSNIEWTKRNMDFCVQVLGDGREGEKCLKRMIKHFKNQKMIVSRTLEALQTLADVNNTGD